MITEDYVNFEIAKLLKEKGFDERTIYHYINGDTLQHNIVYNQYKNSEMGNAYSASTLQMAMKWLVRKYRLYVNVAPSVEGYYWTEKWHSYVEDLNKRYPFGRFIGTFNSPEEACEAAINYCLEQLI